MIGTLIGDLAAWSYENDQKTFWKHLIPEKGQGAVPSVYGHALMKAASHNVLACPWIDTTPVGTPMDGSNYYGQWLMWHIVGAWKDEWQLKDMPDFHSTDKEEGYARMFIMELVRLLRNGASKSEAYHTAYAFEGLSKSWKWRTPGKNLGLLTYIFRAWNAFYLGYDYTSTIHNAVKWPDDRHLTCALAGTFADAMYGCNTCMNKKKYAKSGSFGSYDFGILFTGEEYDYHHALTMAMSEVSRSNRSFFAKNNALTNVERHHWTKCEVRFWEDYTKEDRDKILKAGVTGWDNRFGLYLDDGWLYCYRSGVLLLRFKLIEYEPTKTYRIEEIQLSGERNYVDSVSGMICALEETCKVKVDKEIHNYLRGMTFTIFYHGEEKAPDSLSDEQKCYWWMEQQYYNHRFPEDEQRKMWERDAKTICLKDEGLVLYMQSDKIPIEVKGMLAFTVQDFLYHAPMGGAKEAYEFAKVVGKHYNI